MNNRGRVVLVVLVTELLLASLARGAAEVEARAGNGQVIRVTGPTVDLKALGARGDGVQNDTAAFRAAAEIIQKAGSGRLVIPPGTYVVGEQTHADGQFPYYQEQPIFSVKNLDGLIIEGQGATVRLALGLRFGAFDKLSGKPFHAKPGGFTDRAYAARAGSMLRIHRCRNVLVRNLQLDGNSGALVLGGYFGDVGRQLHAYGIELYHNTEVVVENVHTHHHALDGIIIGWTGLRENDPPTPHTLINLVSEYNARQGLSWVGGRGLRAYRCKFNHTARGAFGSAPSAGLDIEAEESVCRDGYFEDCEFADNGGCGMAADSGDGGYTKFVRCTFWGTTAWSAWNRKPGLEYEDCMFHGSIVHAFGSPDARLATRWTRCTFDDKPWTDGKRPYGGFLAEINGDMENVRFDGCTFAAGACKSLWCSGKGVRFSDCTITHKASLVRNGDFQCLIRGGELVGCRFQELFPSEVKASWYVAAEGTRIVEGKPTTVDGPRVRWGHLNGAVGLIPPGK